MFLKISDDLTVEEVEDRFNECFPFLRIAFYSQPHGEFEPSEKKHRYHPGQKIGDIRSRHFNSAYEIKSWHTVSMVEKDLRDIFGLNAQILRQDGEGRYTQTTFSDNLTLKQHFEVLNQ